MSRYHALRISALVVLAGLNFAVTGQTTKVPMGINVNDHNYWSTPVFTNMALNMADFHLKNADWSGGFSSGCPLDSLDVDSSGYPLQIPQTITGYAPQMVEAALGWFYPAGSYVVLWDGDGDVHFNGASVVSTAPGRMVISRTSTQQTFIAVTRSALGNYLRNLRIIPLSMESTYDPNHPFLPSYMAVVSQFHCLRFMGWQGTNCSEQILWSKRRLQTAITQSTSAEKGPAIEYAIMMCNEANADLWFCVPHKADDNYLDQCAALIKSKLNPNLKLYIEYSNECWNWAPGFCQFGWINATNGVGGCAGAADSIRNAILQIWQTGGSHFESYAWLADRTFKHFRSVWTGGDQQRLVRVCASQVGDARSLTKVQSLGGCDAMAYAPYFGMSGSANTAFCAAAAGSITSQRIVDSINAQVTRDTAQLRRVGDIVRAAGVDLVYYEGGPDFGYSDCTFTGAYGDSVKKANRLQGMYDVYVKAIRSSLTSQVDCKLYVPLILYGAPERYGHLDSSAQVSAFPFAQLPPKWRAMMDCNTAKAPIATLPAVAAGRAAPVVLRPTAVMSVGSPVRAIGRTAGTSTSYAVYDIAGRQVEVWRNGRPVRAPDGQRSASGLLVVRGLLP